MRYPYILIVLFFTSCTAVKLSVPSTFSEQATKMHVKGLNGWMINQQLQFGNYSTSAIKRGWDFTSTVQYTKFGINPEEMLLKVFDIDANHRKLNQRNKFRYMIQDGNLSAEIFATEKFNEKQLVYLQREKNPWIGEASKTQRYEYAFSAAILPFTKEDKDPWSLLIVNRYDASKDTARRLFDRPYVEEEGYATNGKETIQVRPLRIDKVTTKSGKDTKVFGGKILTGYELRWDDGVVGIIDIMDNNIWLANDLDARDKLILSSVASSILLKRMQDVEKDKDEI
jgi:hypothetical protein